MVDSLVRQMRGKVLFGGFSTSDAEEKPVGFESCSLSMRMSIPRALLYLTTHSACRECSIKVRVCCRFRVSATSVALMLGRWDPHWIVSRSSGFPAYNRHRYISMMIITQQWSANCERTIYTQFDWKRSNVIRARLLGRRARVRVHDVDDDNDYAITIP